MKVFAITLFFLSHFTQALGAKEIELYNQRGVKIIQAGSAYTSIDVNIGNGHFRQWEFSHLLKDMNIPNSGYFNTATFYMEECEGSTNPLILECRSTEKRMVLTDNKGAKFEIVIHGKAVAGINIDQTTRSCGAGLKTATTFDMDYFGDFITVDGRSSRGDEEERLDSDLRLDRDRIAGDFLRGITTQLNENSRYYLCF